jgi:hypothetical protein
MVERLRLGVGHASTVRPDPSTLGVGGMMANPGQALDDQSACTSWPLAAFRNFGRAAGVVMDHRVIATAWRTARARAMPRAGVPPLGSQVPQRRRRATVGRPSREGRLGTALAQSSA